MGLAVEDTPDLLCEPLRYGLLDERTWDEVVPVLLSGMPAKVLPKCAPGPVSCAGSGSLKGLMSSAVA